MRACLPGLGTGKREMGSGVEGSVVTHGDSKALHLSWKPGSFSRTTRLPFVLPHSGNLAGLVITKSSRARPGAQPPAFPRGVGRKRWVRPGRCSGLCALRLEPGARSVSAAPASMCGGPVTPQSPVHSSPLFHRGSRVSFSLNPRCLHGFKSHSCVYKLRPSNPTLGVFLRK